MSVFLWAWSHESGSRTFSMSNRLKFAQHWSIGRRFQQHSTGVEGGWPDQRKAPVESHSIMIAGGALSEPGFREDAATAAILPVCGAVETFADAVAW